MATFWDDVTRGYEGPLFAENVHDQLDIDGEKLPGIWAVDVRAGRRLDQPKAAGKNGAQSIFHGYSPGEVSATGTIWMPAQYDKWTDFLDRVWLLPRAQTRLTTNRVTLALDIFHPAAADLGIRSVILVDVTGPRVVAAGARSWTLRFREWDDPPKKAAVTQKIKSSSSREQTRIRDEAAAGVGTGPKGEVIQAGNAIQPKPSADVGP